ncbi:PPOX class F420-dependent oxidoreductase [Amycolatopsis sp. H20-H5]|uniref:PPOX class F420-dependent oxidoreductase n=1 Tax=Amycolatopsis sp. H20-H5 TaxID=3046309 RepID=UPI002DBC60FF|nr:PPOX class F420-dependent oxidoreductase [Amycolatopsis sp. H20-H5]MEC3975970.1 PPOX class F420-dependent oxidoreductase [Amycolatopsis sp. H20-H5]
MTFSKAEVEYLTTQIHGRMATVQPNGTLQVSPVGFSFNPETSTIDVLGMNLAQSRKYRNIADNGRVAFVVDDILSTDPWRVRCLEIRGHAEVIAPSPALADDHLDGALIRIHPERVISFGVDDPEHEPHELVPHNRNV